jgi:hypothetical protein
MRRPMYDRHLTALTTKMFAVPAQTLDPAISIISPTKICKWVQKWGGLSASDRARSVATLSEWSSLAHLAHDGLPVSLPLTLEFADAFG